MRRMLSRPADGLTPRSHSPEEVSLPEPGPIGLTLVDKSELDERAGSASSCSPSCDPELSVE